jgi:hypothetical protein
MRPARPYLTGADRVVFWCLAVAGRYAGWQRDTSFAVHDRLLSSLFVRNILYRKVSYYVPGPSWLPSRVVINASQPRAPAVAPRILPRRALALSQESALEKGPSHWLANPLPLSLISRHCGSHLTGVSPFRPSCSPKGRNEKAKRRKD